MTGTRATIPPSETVVIFGCGTLGTILAKGLQDFPSRYEVIATCRSAKRATELASTIKVQRTVDNQEAARRASIAILAVRPQDMPTLLMDIAGILQPRTLCIALAAGLPLDFYEQRLPCSISVVRAMPTPMMSVSCGYVALAAGQHVKDTEIEKARAIFSGRCDGTIIIPERAMNVFAALHGSVAALLFLLVAKLMNTVDAEVQGDFSIREITHSMLIGVGRLLAQSDALPQELAEAICTPGGMTAAGVEIWQQEQIGDRIAKALHAVLDRGAELGRYGG